MPGPTRAGRGFCLPGLTQLGLRRLRGAYFTVADSSYRSAAASFLQTPPPPPRPQPAPLPCPLRREGRASLAPWGSRGRDGTERGGFLAPEGERLRELGPRRTADELRPGAATRPSAHTKGRGPRTKLSLQALRTLPNPRATVETATPSTRYFLPGPSL